MHGISKAMGKLKEIHMQIFTRMTYMRPVCSSGNELKVKFGTKVEFTKIKYSFLKEKLHSLHTGKTCRYAQTVRVSSFWFKIDYVIVIKNF